VLSGCSMCVCVCISRVPSQDVLSVNINHVTSHVTNHRTGNAPVSEEGEKERSE